MAGRSNHYFCCRKCQQKTANRDYHKADSKRARYRGWLYYHRNKHKVSNRARQAAQRIKYRERMLVVHAAWRRRNPDALRSYNANARAKRLNAKAKRVDTTPIGERLTGAEWRALLEVYGHKCCYCGAGGKMTQDHYIPLAKGGLHTCDNVVPACLSCNSRKGTKLGEDFRLELAQKCS